MHAHVPWDFPEQLSVIVEYHLYVFLNFSRHFYILVSSNFDQTLRFPETFLSGLQWDPCWDFSVWQPQFPVRVPSSTARLALGASSLCWNPPDTHPLVREAWSDRNKYSMKRHQVTLILVNPDMIIGIFLLFINGSIIIRELSLNFIITSWTFFSALLRSFLTLSNFRLYSSISSSLFLDSRVNSLTLDCVFNNLQW